MKMRKYQVRQFGGKYPEFQNKEDKVYSVIMHIDAPKGTKTYEHKEYINLSYADALSKANEFENSNAIPNMSEWQELDVI